MSAPGIHAATLPPAGLPGLDPSWSRLLEARDADGVLRTWHVLDNGPSRSIPVTLTLLCVHGNPTWSYLWRRVLQAAPPDVRVVAVDHLDMGYSERTGTTRRLAQRIDDLSTVSAALGITGPVVTVAHDWGGPISLGWALAHRAQLQGVVLLNTAVHQPEGSPAPSVIRIARSSALLHLNTVATPAFVRGTSALCNPRLARPVADAFAAPYQGADRREAIGAFVADIPLEPDHPSAPVLDAIADGITTLDVPALLLWGPGDPVFSDRYLVDLLGRLPHADVQRYEGARHLVIEDAPALVSDLYTWIGDLGSRSADDETAGIDEPGATAIAGVSRTPMWSDLERRAATNPQGTAIAEPVDGGWRHVSWALLADRVDALVRGLHARGVRRGDRVAVLITPGADLIAVVYACWRLGATVVVTDAGLGLRGIHRALRGATPEHIIAIPKAMALVRSLALPGRRIATSELASIARSHAYGRLPEPPSGEDDAVVVFTSGSTGPAKGVVYRHRQVEATRDLLREHYSISDSDALVAAFAPWAVLGPALGIVSSIPDMDVTSPRTLQATALADAVGVVSGTLMWASPAAFDSVLRTADRLSDEQMAAFGSLRLVLGAGAPVSTALLHGMARLCPQAEIRTPYGMTEALPVCDVTIEEIDSAGPGDGVLVGHPVPGVDVAISALDAMGEATGPLSSQPGVLGEVVVRGQHIKDHYDRLWSVERRASRDPGWHRTGDVGHLDDLGRLWIGGRLAHVITTPDGPLAPVGIEQRLGALPGIDAVACVGIGPAGTQQVAVVAVLAQAARRRGPLADPELLDLVRSAVSVPVVAVLLRRRLPVDIRHNSKIDRTELARWASAILAGRGSA